MPLRNFSVTCRICSVACCNVL